MDVLVSSKEENVLSLRGMVDIALGTPEVGAVNFNMLHTLLNALISKLDLDSAVIAIAPDNEQPQGGTSPLKIVSMTTTPYHLLQDRLKIIEKQISDLNSLPSNKEILDKIFGNEKITENNRLASDLWQTLNIRKKVTCNEEGIDRLSSLIDNILGEMKQLRSDNEALKKKLEDMESLKGVDDKVNGLQNDLASLLAEFNKLKNRMNEYPTPDIFKNLVSWDGLEKALRGIKDEMDELKKPTERIVINMGTEPMSRPQSSKSNGPSEVCADMLEKIGNLREAHELLDQRVVVLEEEMPNKADKKDLENLKFPDDLLRTINQLKSNVESLMSSKNRDGPVTINTDTEALARIRDILNSLQEKMKSVNETVDKLSNENKELLKQIEALFGITTDHESRKADIGFVEGQLRMKADKNLLDSKVSITLFDETTKDLNALINDVLRKLMAAEEELRNLLKSMASDLNGKVDRDDLNALKEWIEKRLRALADKFKNLRGYEANDDEAAGLRKQLLQHFHCISCDRPVDMMPQGLSYGNGLPDPKGLPPTKSLRPYTTYELEAIRQQARGLQEPRVFLPKYMSYGSDIIDVYQTPRPCGGSHTTTYSHKKVVRMGNINNSNFEEEIVQRPTKEELDLQGVDGHIYKGRADRNQTMVTNNNGYNEQNYQDRLPPVPMTQRSQTLLNNNNLTPRGGFITSRPKSAVKITPRPATSSGNSHSRPESARLPIYEPDSRPTTPVKNDSQNVNHIEHEIIDVNEAVIISDAFELEMINGENHGQINDESIQS